MDRRSRNPASRCMPGIGALAPAVDIVPADGMERNSNRLIRHVEMLQAQTPALGSRTATMHDPDPRDANRLASNQGHAQKTGPASSHRGDGMARPVPDRASNELSGTTGTFAAALFAVVLLAALFIRLSYHLQSHWKAAVVIGTGFGLWLLVAALLRLRTSGAKRLLAALGSAAIVVGFGFRPACLSRLGRSQVGADRRRRLLRPETGVRSCGAVFRFDHRQVRHLGGPLRRYDPCSVSGGRLRLLQGRLPMRPAATRSAHVGMPERETRSLNI